MKKEEIEFRLLELDLDVKKLLSTGMELTQEQGEFLDKSLAEMEELKRELQLYNNGVK